MEFSPHKDHYFNKNYKYKNNGIKILDFLVSNLSSKQKKALLSGLQYNSKQFDENKYLQHAVESTTNYFFKKNFKNFKYEPQSNKGNKNMDCGIEIDNFKINFEIKCPKLFPTSKNILYIKPIGYESYDTANKKLEKTINILQNNLPNFKYDKICSFNEKGGMKNKISGLLDFLIQTEEKSIKNEINILIVSLYSKLNLAEWITYYLEIIENKKLLNVDGVIFTNTINHHINNFENNSYPWELKKHLLVFVENPYKTYESNIELNTIIQKIFNKNIIILKKIFKNEISIGEKLILLLEELSQLEKKQGKNSFKEESYSYLNH